jgi:hypothetical protein
MYVCMYVISYIDDDRDSIPNTYIIKLVLSVVYALSEENQSLVL